MIHPIAHPEKMNLKFVPPSDDSGLGQAIVVSGQPHAVTGGLCVIEQQSTDH
jgi:hypothetical protein